MLQKFGEHIRGWFAGIVIGVIAVAFVAWGLQYYIERDHGATAAIAVVNGDPITQQVFSKQVRHQQLMAEHSLGRGLTVQEALQLKTELLKKLISDKILLQAAEKLGFSVSDDAIQSSVQRSPLFQEDGHFSQARFSNFMYTQGFQSAGPFFKAVRNNEMREQLNMLFTSAFVVPRELKSAYKLQHQTRNYSYATLPVLPVEKKIVITSKMITDYYHANKSQFMIPEKVSVAYMTLSRAALMAKTQVTEKEVRAYYDGNKASFKMPASWKVARITTKTQKEMDGIVAQLKAGKSFAAVMKQKHSNWQVVTQDISAIDIAPGLMSVLDKLRVHQVSEPLLTPNSRTIVQLLSKTPSRARPFNAVKAQVKRMLLSQRVDQIIAKKSEQLSNLVFTNPMSLGPASKATGLAIQTSTLMSAAGEKTGVFSNKEVLAAVFSKDVLSGGANSNPISLNGQGILVLRILKHVPSAEKPLADVKSGITATLKKEMALAKLAVNVAKLQSELSKGGSHKALHWLTKKNALRSQAGINPVLLKSIFKAPLNHVGVAALDSGYVFFKVTAIHPGDWALATLKQKSDLAAGLAQMHGGIERSIYINELRSKAKVTIEDKSLSSSWS